MITGLLASWISTGKLKQGLKARIQSKQILLKIACLIYCKQGLTLLVWVEVNTLTQKYNLDELNN